MAKLAVTRELVGKVVCSSYVCYSPEDNKLLPNTRNNHALLAIDIDNLHDLFQTSKMVIDIASFTCEWPNSQLDVLRSQVFAGWS